MSDPVPSIDTDPEVEFVEAPPQVVRVSYTLRQTSEDGMLSLAMEGVPVVAASSVGAELIAAARAAVGLAGEPSSISSSPTGYPAPAAPSTTAPAAHVVSSESDGEDIQVIPATQVKHFKLAFTENGIRRAKVFTAKFHKMGIDLWPEPLAAAGVDPERLEPKMEYPVPANWVALKVRFRTPDGGGRPYPDRVVEVVVK